MSQTVDVFRDAELIEMFSDDLGLLAISDAIAQSRPVTRSFRFRTGSKFLPTPAFVRLSSRAARSATPRSWLPLTRPA